MDKEGSVQRFLDLIRRSHRGKFKIYIGMSAGVGKSYRMLQEAHQLLDAGVDVCIGFIETHGRAETEALVAGLPLVPRRRLFYKGKELEEMDTQAILNLHPEIVVVDELAHTNIEGSGNPKRWQDVMQLLDAGISVITAVNIQHIEGLNESVQEITGVEVHERVPDSVLAMADEVVNIDLTADELIDRLKAGKSINPTRSLRHSTISSRRRTSSNCANWRSRRWRCAWRRRSRTRSPQATSAATTGCWPSSTPRKSGRAA